MFGGELRRVPFGGGIRGPAGGAGEIARERDQNQQVASQFGIANAADGRGAKGAGGICGRGVFASSHRAGGGGRVGEGPGPGFAAGGGGADGGVAGSFSRSVALGAVAII